jgi:alpha-beta hydrolase superfamily lysophospholipase
MGYANVTARTYEGLRHEILNEVGRENIWQDVVSVFEKWDSK